MVKGQSGPCLAVEFRADEIALFALEDQASGGVGWAETHAVAVDAPDLNEQAAAMRAAASARSGAERPGVDIWLPREQIATIDLAPGGQAPRAAALARARRLQPVRVPRH